MQPASGHRFSIRYRLRTGWPALAWLARCQRGSREILVDHGHGVEIHDQWFAEAAWDGDYAAGELDLSATVFGSGARVRYGEAVFVSSSSTCDRLHHVGIGDTRLISNSLACLTVAAKITLDPWYPWYYEDFCTISCGIDDYQATVFNADQRIQLSYYRNLVWNGERLTERDKPRITHAPADYREYHDLVTTTLRRLSGNMGAVQRRTTYQPISTSSAGYDSLAVTVLSRSIDTRQVICVPQDRIDRDDSAVALIRQLDMQPVEIQRDDWRATTLAEVPFIVADGCGRDVWLLPAAQMLRGRLLLTGNFGDSAWAMATPARPGQLFRDDRHGPAGLSLSEFRLAAGFLHCPLPYIGATEDIAINTITNSDEMRPWRRSGPYERPIPRRIVEQAGIARDAFARRKTATAVHLFRRQEFDRFLAGSAALRDYMTWIRDQSRSRAPPDVSNYPQRSADRETIEVPLFRHLFPWALQRWQQNYSD